MSEPGELERAVTPFPSYTHAELDRHDDCVYAMDFYGGRINTVLQPRGAEDIHRTPLELGIISLTALGLSSELIYRLYDAKEGSLRRRAINWAYKDLGIEDEAGRVQSVVNHFNLGFLEVTDPLCLPHPAAPHCTALPMNLAALLAQGQLADRQIARRTIVPIQQLRQHYGLMGVAPVTFMYASGAVVVKDMQTHLGNLNLLSRDPGWSQITQEQPDYAALLPNQDKRRELRMYRNGERHLISWKGFIFESRLGETFDSATAEIVLESLFGASHKSIGAPRGLSPSSIAHKLGQAKDDYGLKSDTSRNSAELATLALYNGDLQVLESPLFAQLPAPNSVRLASAIACGLPIKGIADLLRVDDAEILSQLRQLKRMLGTSGLSDTVVASLGCGLIDAADVLKQNNILYNPVFHEAKRRHNSRQPLRLQLGTLVVPQIIKRPPAVKDADQSPPEIKRIEDGVFQVNWRGATFRCTLKMGLPDAEQSLAVGLILGQDTTSLIKEYNTSRGVLSQIKKQLLADVGLISPTEKGEELITLAAYTGKLRIDTPRRMPEIPFEKRDITILKHLATGASHEAIAKRLNISTVMVGRRRQHLARVFGVKQTPAMVAAAFACDLIAPDEVMALGFNAFRPPVKELTRSFRPATPEIRPQADGSLNIAWGSGIFAVNLLERLKPFQQNIATALMFGESRAEVAASRNTATRRIGDEMIRIKRLYGFTHAPYTHCGHGEMSTMALLHGDIRILRPMRRPEPVSEREIDILIHLAAGIKPAALKRYLSKTNYHALSIEEELNRLATAYGVKPGGLVMAAYASRTISTQQVIERDIIKADQLAS